jgi:polyisoprenoid-binding protein YceI
MRNLIVGAMAAVLAATAAPAATWDIDASHSSAGFSVRHLMITNVRGAFGGLKGSAEWDGKDPASVKVEATIDMATVDTGDAKRDEHLRAADFFDVAKFPTMTFKSKKAMAAGQGKMKIVGDLTLRGVTKEVTLDVEGPTAAIKDPWGNAKVGATATTKINRQDFGVSWSKTMDGGGLVVGDEVSVTIDLELKERKAPEAPK